MRMKALLLAAALLPAVAACGSSTAPAPVLLTLLVTPPPDFTNQGTLTLAGSTDAGATVSVTAGGTTATGQAGPGGSFSVPVSLLRNQANVLIVKATSPAGDTSRTVTVSTTHDDVPPVLTFTAPSAGASTSGQANFTVQVSYSDGGVGVDPTSFAFSSQRGVGGVYLRSGRTSTAFPAGADLGPLFQVTPGGASWFVPDTLAWAPGQTVATARVSDRAGNTATIPFQFIVSPDPDAVIAADAAGVRGQRISLDVGLRNAESLGGVQFDLVLNATAIASVDSAFVVGRASAMRNGAMNIIGNNLRVVLLDAGGNLLNGGQGEVVRVFVTLRATANPGQYNVGLTGTVAADAIGRSRPVQAFGSTLTLQ